MSPQITILQKGDASKKYPFTICFLSNPVIQRSTGGFAVDGICLRPDEFDECVKYSYNCLFGKLPGQAETFLGDPEICERVRVLSIFVADVEIHDRYCLVSEFANGYYLFPRRAMYRPFLSRIDNSVYADVIYAISGSSTHKIAAAQFTNDDENSEGVLFKINGQDRYHRFFNTVPGTIAMHYSQRKLGPIHEFSHALSSYENGMIVDLYSDITPFIPDAINKNRSQPPLPRVFSDYVCSTFNGVLDTDVGRGGLGYPTDWGSFHCKLHNPNLPAIMDNWEGSALWVQCEHDVVTRRFLMDRVRAKLARP